MINEVIRLDSNFAKEIGFTSDKFDGYLWQQGDVVFISLLVSLHPDDGNFSKLLDAIEVRGMIVKVPTPSLMMQSILKKKGFKRNIEQSDFGEVEVFSR